MYKDKQLSEDIFDLIKVNALSDKQDDTYAEMSRGFARDAGKNLYSFLHDKTMEWDGQKNEIKIGRDVILKVIIK